jgi:glycosyltransferase involved in cell wall biosynthesis
VSKNKPKTQKKKPVILQVLPELKSGGVERGTVEMVKAMVANGGFVPIVASAGGPMVSQVTNAGGKHIKLPLASKNPFVIWQNVTNLIKIIEENDVDIVHARSRAPAWSAYLACKKTDCHFITTFHGVYSLPNGIKRWYNSIMVKGEKVIAISEFIKKHAQKNYSVKKNSMVVIHRGVDLNHFDRKHVPKSRIIQKAEKIAIEHDRPIILLPGRITEWKGHEFLLDALKNIDKKKYFCLFVGDVNKHKDYAKRVYDKIVELDLVENVRVIKHVRDMPALYSLVDIVVSASMRPEAFGRVAIEAQAMEKLVIATKHGGACETIIDGKTGWLVKPGDVDELQQTIEKVLKITDRQRKIITNRAKKHAQENFSLQNMTDKTLDVYRQVLRTKKKA